MNARCVCTNFSQEFCLNQKFMLRSQWGISRKCARASITSCNAQGLKHRYWSCSASFAATDEKIPESDPGPCMLTTVHYLRMRLNYIELHSSAIDSVDRCMASVTCSSSSIDVDIRGSLQSLVFSTKMYQFDPPDDKHYCAIINMVILLVAATANRLCDKSFGFSLWTIPTILFHAGQPPTYNIGSRRQYIRWMHV